MIQIHPSIPPLRVWILHVFLSSCPSLQIIFHAASCKKRLVIPYDGPFKQQSRNTGSLGGRDAGSGAGSEATSHQRDFHVYARSSQVRRYHSVWCISPPCCYIDAPVPVLICSSCNAVSGIARCSYCCIRGRFQEIGIL